MKKNKLMIIGIILLLIAVVVVVITLSPSWSKKSFEGIVKETVTQPDGEVRLIIQRTTEIYANPMNSLHISKDTVLVDVDGATISIEDFQQGDTVKVTLKDSFVEEIPFYYPTVYEVRMVHAHN